MAFKNNKELLDQIISEGITCSFQDSSYKPYKPKKRRVSRARSYMSQTRPKRYRRTKTGRSKQPTLGSMVAERALGTLIGSAPLVYATHVLSRGKSRGVKNLYKKTRIKR